MKLLSFQFNLKSTKWLPQAPAGHRVSNKLHKLSTLLTIASETFKLLGEHKKSILEPFPNMRCCCRLPEFSSLHYRPPVTLDSDEILVIFLKCQKIILTAAHTLLKKVLTAIKQLSYGVLFLNIAHRSDAKRESRQVQWNMQISHETNPTTAKGVRETSSKTRCKD